jgi:hypothetical protein
MSPARSVADPDPVDQPSPRDQPASCGLNRRLRRFLATTLSHARPVLAASAARCQADRYRKSFDHFAHACLLLFHGLADQRSLRQTHAAFPLAGAVFTLSGLARDPGSDDLALSYSQLAASSTTRPAAFLAGFVADLAQQVRAEGDRPGGALPRDLRLLDTTFLRLPLALVPWLPSAGGHDVPGLRALVAHDPALDLPEVLVLTDTRHNDCQALDAGVLADPARLAALRGQTVVCDLGFYSHARFAALHAAGVHLVTRLHAQAAYRVEAARAVQPPLADLDGGRIAVCADQQITLGSPNNRAGAVLPGLRLVEAVVAPNPRAARNHAQPVTYRLVTDRLDLEAATVVQIYLWRWEIELFFRWLKRIIGLPRWLGYSPNAVALTIWLAIAVHLLTVLAARAVGLARRSPTLLARLRWALATLTAADFAAARAPVQLALPGLIPAAAPT